MKEDKPGNLDRRRVVLGLAGLPFAPSIMGDGHPDPIKDADIRDFATKEADIKTFTETFKELGLKPEDCKVIDSQSDPAAYRIFKRTYEKVVDLLPYEHRKKFREPVWIVVRREAINSYGALRKNGKNDITAVTTQVIYNLPPDELTSAIAHELGHCLMNYSKAVAEKISGINSVKAKPLLDALKAKISRIYPLGDVEGVYNACRNELIADGIAIRATCMPGAAIKYINDLDIQQDNIYIQPFMNGTREKLPPSAEKEIREELQKLRRRIREEGIFDHPDIRERREFMKLIAVESCPGPERGR